MCAHTGKSEDKRLVLLLPRGHCGSNSGGQAWQQAPLPIEPSCTPPVFGSLFVETDSHSAARAELSMYPKLAILLPQYWGYRCGPLPRAGNFHKTTTSGVANPTSTSCTSPAPVFTPESPYLITGLPKPFDTQFPLGSLVPDFGL